MKKILISLLSLLMLLSVSCNDDNPSDDGNTNLSGLYLPLKIGNWWKYAASGANMPDTIVYTASGDSTINNQSWFIFSNDYNSGIVMHRHDGNIAMMRVGNSEYKIFDETCKTGDSLVTNYTTNNVQFKVVSKILEKGVTKTVNGKEYKDVLMVRLYFYTSENQSEFSLVSIEDDYFAKNIGAIKMYIEGFINKELVSYSVTK